MGHHSNYKAVINRADYDAVELEYGNGSYSMMIFSEVKHKTFVEVNEEGTEAAAVTSIGVEAASAGGNEIFLKIDTSFYSSHYTGTYNNMTDVYDYSGKSTARDIRNGTGDRSENNHEVLVAFSAVLSQSCKLNIGLYINGRNFKINTSEPVTVNRYSEHHSKSTGNYTYQYDNLVILDEVKRLVWSYSSDYFTLQIPVILDFTISKNFGLAVGVNRMLKDWEINETTTAYFTTRKRNENGVVKEENNFGERYSPAADKYTDSDTDMFFKLNANISPEFKVNLLVNPEFQHLLRVSQWWLSFEGRF